MTGGIVTLGAVDRADLVYAAECAGEVLLVELRRLCKVGRMTEVVQLEQVRAALSACNDDLRGVDVGKALALHVLCEAVSDRALYAEDRLLARMTQRDRAEREVDVERQTHILLADRHRQLVIRLAEDLDCAQNDLYAVLSARLLADCAGHLEDHGIAHVGALDVADRVTLEGALDQAALYAHDNEGEVRHIADTVYRAAEGDLAADCVADALYGVNILTRFMYHFHIFNASLIEQSQMCYIVACFCRYGKFFAPETVEKQLFFAVRRRSG